MSKRKPAKYDPRPKGMGMSCDEIRQLLMQYGLTDYDVMCGYIRQPITVEMIDGLPLVRGNCALEHKVCEYSGLNHEKNCGTAYHDSPYKK